MHAGIYQNVLFYVNLFNISCIKMKSFHFQLCVSRLLDNQSASLATVKMQVYFDMNYTSRGKYIQGCL